MPIPDIQPQYQVMGTQRLGLNPPPRNMKQGDTEYGREARRASAVRDQHDDDELLPSMRSPVAAAAASSPVLDVTPVMAASSVISVGHPCAKSSDELAGSV